MAKLFKEVRHKNVDPNYEHNLNSKHRQHLRDCIEKMYEDVEQFIGDSHFEDLIQTDFSAAVWQLYVGYFLLKKSKVSLVKSAGHGPDFVLADGTIVEAVVAKRGTGADKPFSWEEVRPTSDENGIKLYPVRSMPYPDPQIVMRVTQAIDYKMKQRQAWISTGVVRADQPYIIAINAGLLDEASDCSDGISYGARVAFAVGELVMVVPLNLSEEDIKTPEPYSKLNHKPSVSKKSGTEIDSNLFLNKSNEDLSGILYSAHTLINVINGDMFSDLELILNGFAKNKISADIFSGIQVTWADVDELKNQYSIRSNRESSD